MKTLFHLFLGLIASLLFMKANAQIGSPITSATLDWKVNRSGELKYLLYLPPDYKESDGKRWPLMLFLHGAGERGSDVQRVAIHGPLSLVKQGTNFPFIIVAPQCPSGQIWENEPLLQLLDSVEKQHRVDEKRIYLTGLSMGGYGTWKLGLAQPSKFAAIAPICGGCNMIEVILGPRDKADAFKSLPIWAFHGAKDDVVPLSESERVVEGLRKGGVKEVKFTVYPDTKHDSWKEAYKTPALYEWMLSKSR
ncbi:MAG TPA: prolyl oligopeptidase family serine peptidase [Verrucomicrobiae bacterium]|nr:prolyl oligopeptidase family serine peptidase [Verrucomicrobiae bacterium]